MSNVLRIAANSININVRGVMEVVGKVFSECWKARQELEADASEAARNRFAALQCAAAQEPRDWHDPAFTDFRSVEVVFSYPTKISAALSNMAYRIKMGQYSRATGEDYCLSFQIQPELTAMCAMRFDAYVMREMFTQLETLGTIQFDESGGLLRMSTPPPNKGTDVMTPDHERWVEFIRRLKRKTKNCDSTMNRPFARAILEDMGGFDVEATLEFFSSRGGYCDCEIILNVADWGIFLGDAASEGEKSKK